MSLEAHYPKSYGAWAGLPEGTPPNFTRCCAEVADTSTRWTRFHQCTRKNGHGPDGAYCAQHVPEVVEQRNANRIKKEEERWQQDRLRFAGPRFYRVLKQIADGHNDPRSLAKEAIASYDQKSGEKP